LSGGKIDMSWLMIQKIEQLFEVVESNVPCALFAVVASFAMTGCLRFFWE
jgi:hypothetical protein